MYNKKFSYLTLYMFNSNFKIGILRWRNAYFRLVRITFTPIRNMNSTFLKATFEKRILLAKPVTNFGLTNYLINLFLRLQTVVPFTLRFPKSYVRSH